MDKKTCTHCKSDQLYWADTALEGKVSVSGHLPKMWIGMAKEANLGAIFCANCRRVILVAHDNEENIQNLISKLKPVNPE